MPTIQFKRTFSAAHRLSGYEGKCSRIHGHNFEVEVEITTDLPDATGFAVEFDVIKEVIDIFDHRLILSDEDKIADELLDDWVVRVARSPTTEFMAAHLAELIVLATLRDNLRASWASVGVELRETPSIMASAAVRRER